MPVYDCSQLRQQTGVQIDRQAPCKAQGAHYLGPSARCLQSLCSATKNQPHQVMGPLDNQKIKSRCATPSLPCRAAFGVMIMMHRAGKVFQPLALHHLTRQCHVDGFVQDHGRMICAHLHLQAMLLELTGRRVVPGVGALVVTAARPLATLGRDEMCLPQRPECRLPILRVRCSTPRPEAATTVRSHHDMPQPVTLPHLPSFRKQHLNVEFASLRSAKLDGVFVSITPSDPSLWVGVIFVRRGKQTQIMQCHSTIHHRGVFTSDRSICPCRPTLSDIFPTQLSRSATTRDLFYRCLPPTAYASHYLHLHDWIAGHRYC